MNKILVFGNSGSGKSTLAKRLCNSEGLAHLDLDTLAWLPISPPERRPLNESSTELFNFINAHDSWVIEGCYADLLEIAAPFSNKVIFMNLPVEECIENAKKRPWEPHKYPSKEAQDKNLSMLIDWIRQYKERTDTCSFSMHTALFEQCSGKKIMHTSNQRNT